MGFLDNAGLTHLWGKIKGSMQDKLTGAAGQVVGFNADGAATAVPGWSNPNLLDNWYFVGGGSQAGADKLPINQQGKTEYTDTVITIDRWTASGNYKATLQSDGILLENLDDSSGVEFSIKLESGFLQPGTYTLSALTDIISGQVDFNVRRMDNWTAFFAKQNIPTGLASVGGLIDYTDVFIITSFYLHPGASVKIKAVKLELGPVQTLAHQDADGNWVLNDPPPNKALELAKCQRYMLVIPGTGSTYPEIGIGCSISNNIVTISIPAPVAMRIKPAVSISGNWVVRGYGGNNPFNVSNISSYGSGSYSQSMLNLTLAGVPGLTPFQSYIMFRDNDPTAEIVFDANL